MEYLVYWLYILVIGAGCARANDYKGRMFSDAGIMWMENAEGIVYFQHVYLGGSTVWRNKPEPQIVARTVKGAHNFTHMDVDYDNKTIMMVDAQTKSIMALTFDEKTHGTYHFWTLYQGTSSKVNGIAVDWTTDIVYWTDAVYDVIYAASRTYDRTASVIVDGLENPYGIATYPQKGFLFWTELGTNRRPRLVRSSLGGRRIQVLADFMDRVAYGLHIDYLEERLYWVYSRDTERGIQYSNLNGRKGKIIKNAKAADFFIFDIDLYNEQLMYLERHGDRAAVEVSGADNKSIFKMAVQGVATGLRVLDPDRQYKKTNMCEFCPGVCTRSNETEDCFCVEDLKSSLDEFETRMFCGSERFSGILVNKGGGIFAMPTNFAELSPSSTEVLVEPREIVPSRSIVKAMTSDIGTNKIYFYEHQNKIIKSVRMQSMAGPEVISTAVDEVGGLAFDPLGKNLYWTDVIQGHIMVANENGEYPFVLHDDLERPSAIAMHPGMRYRYLYWSEFGIRSSVWRSYLDGADKEAIMTNLRIRGITAMTVDIDTNKLYICGSTEIYVSDLNGNNSKELYYSRQHRFTGITILHDYLVLSDTDYRSSGLHAFDKTDTEGESLVFVGKATYPFFYHGNWHGVTYHHPSNQPSGSVCGAWSTQCDQLCLAGRPRTVRCACTLGYVTEGSECQLVLPYRPYILVADQRYRKLILILHTPRSYVDIPVKAIKQPYSIAYDYVRTFKNEKVERQGQVYWSDLEGGAISRSYMDGSYQEVIVHDPSAHITEIELDSDSRLLFYLSRPRQPDLFYGWLSDIDAGNLIGSSLIVLNIDTGLTKTILYSALDEPTSIAVSEQHGYVYVVERSHIWRVTMNGSNLEPLISNVHSTAIAIMDDYLYFTNVSEGRLIHEPVWTHLLRSDVTGDNIMFLLELSCQSAVSDLALDRNFIYWTNTRTRGVQYVNLSGPYNVANVMPVDKLVKPTSLFVHLTDHRGSPCSKISCAGLCLSTVEGDVQCDYSVSRAHVDTDNTELCRIPEILHGEVEDNQVGRVVADGYSAHVQCFAMHRISNSFPITCVNGSWSHIPHCILEYDICGDIKRGYKVYHKPGQYFVYPEMAKVHVILIGGGGGGYDILNDNITAAGKAGDGGNSSFGDLVAYGGRGGSLTKGGKGGKGFSPGGDGGDPGGNCTTGGTAGQSSPPLKPGRPGKSIDLFTGAGRYSDECTKLHISATAEKYSGPGGSEDGYYGGGAGAREGGAGGGGGWARTTFAALTPRELVPIHVGKAGFPSYSPPGPGIVVVTWGDFQLDTYVEKNDVINSCIFD